MRGRGSLTDARVMVVGCGALGNEVLKNLVLCGVGHIFCVDFDRVEEGNLSRSVLFRPQDAVNGRPKVDVVRERLLEIDGKADIRTLEGDIVHDVGLGLIKAMDVVISCVDNRWARFIINRHCIRMDRPWVDGGISVSEGTVRVFVPGANCYACGLDSADLAGMKNRVSCANTVKAVRKAASAPTTSITASIVGAVQVQEALKIISGDRSDAGRMFYYDGDAPASGVAEFKAFDYDCPEHECWEPVERTAFSNDMTVSALLDTVCRDKKEDVTLLLREDVFVDYVVSRTDGSRLRIMQPGRRVAAALPEGSNPCDFYQNEYRTIDGTFPYSGLTLSELGIPANDVLRFRGGGRDYYLELDSYE